jgi:hypothetical protein
MLESFRRLRKCSDIWSIWDSDISPAKARRTPSSDKILFLFLCGLCVFAGNIPILLVAAQPRVPLR